MRLRSIDYSEWEGQPQAWTLEKLSLGESNLLVGRNASGKTRALNVIHGLARFLAGLGTPKLSGTYTAEFIHGNSSLVYFLKMDDEQVKEEKFSIDGSVKLQRSSGGSGKIYAEKVNNGDYIEFQTPTTELAAVTRRDNIQHSYLEQLYSWGSSVRHYPFGSELGKSYLAVFVEDGARRFDERNPNEIVGLFRHAERKYGDIFIRSVIEDVRRIDYNIEKIGTMSPVSIRISSNIPGDLMGLYVKEKDLPGITDQQSMSQGMFRAISIIIQVNYSRLSDNSTCIIIDDIGEGLDFERSCKMIDLLREKSFSSDVQLILSTNDRFVMNQVPLEEWSVLQRRGNRVQVRNYQNSRDIFEEFKFTGLSNFSFFEMDCVNGNSSDNAEMILSE